MELIITNPKGEAELSFNDEPLVCTIEIDSNVPLKDVICQKGYNVYNLYDKEEV